MSGPGRIKLPLKDQRVEDLLLWRDVKKSGAVFVGATAIFIFFQFSNYSVLSLLAYALSLVVFAFLIWQTAAGVLKKAPPPIPQFVSEGIPEAQLRAYADRITPIVNKGLSFTNQILKGNNPILSFVVGGGFFLIAFIISNISILFLAYLPVFLAFVLPKVYELRKDEVDQAIDTGRSKITALRDMVKTATGGKPASPAESSSVRKQQ